MSPDPLGSRHRGKSVESMALVVIAPYQSELSSLLLAVCRSKQSKKC